MAFRCRPVCAVSSLRCQQPSATADKPPPSDISRRSWLPGLFLNFHALFHPRPRHHGFQNNGAGHFHGPLNQIHSLVPWFLEPQREQVLRLAGAFVKLFLAKKRGCAFDKSPGAPALPGVHWQAPYFFSLSLVTSAATVSKLAHHCIT